MNHPGLSSGGLVAITGRQVVLRCQCNKSSLSKNFGKELWKVKKTQELNIKQTYKMHRMDQLVRIRPFLLYIPKARDVKPHFKNVGKSRNFESMKMWPRTNFSYWHRGFNVTLSLTTITTLHCAARF